MTHDSWTDTIGQSFQRGDYIAVASSSGRSPQMVIARVERINSHKADGTEITEFVGWDRETNQRITQPSATVTAKPVLDGRGFHRWSAKKWNDETRTFDPRPGGPRSVTYTLPGNIIKLGPAAVLALQRKLDS